MCMDSCNRCGTILNTDAAPEVYREEFNYECLCDNCYDERVPAIEARDQEVEEEVLA